MKLTGLYLSRLVSLGIWILLSIFPEILISAEKQELKISGIVLSLDNLPLSGVNVIIKGTAEGTVTDNQGNFSITVPGDSTILYFSHLGYRAKEIPVNKRQPLTIILSSDPIGSAIKSAQNNKRTQNESRRDTYWDLVEEARKDMKSQIEPDWDMFWNLMKKASEDMQNQVMPDYDRFLDLIEKARQDMRDQVKFNRDIF